MVMRVNIAFNKQDLKAIKAKAILKGASRAMRRASAKSVTAMKTDASKRVRKRKHLRAKAIKRAIHPQKNKGRSLDSMQWGINVAGNIVRLSDNKFRQLKKMDEQKRASNKVLPQA